MRATAAMNPDQVHRQRWPGVAYCRSPPRVGLDKRPPEGVNYPGEGGQAHTSCTGCTASSSSAWSSSSRTRSTVVAYMSAGVFSCNC